MKELLALKQGDDTVYQYAQKFNSLCQRTSRGHRCQKDETFHRSELYERLNLLEPNSYHELVNKAISQEDAMMKVQKRKEETERFCFGSRIGQEISLRQEECAWVFPIIRIRPLKNDSVPA
jgi:hypothetical protein